MDVNKYSIVISPENLSDDIFTKSFSGNNKKKSLTENLVVTMKKNEIDCFDINGGALVYKQNKVKKAINGKSLLAALQNYYKNDTKSAEELTKHILDSREEKIKETLVRKIDK